LDSEFLAISLAFMMIGAAGIILFYGPPNATGDSCYCLIPSPEPGAAQGTSSIILALGVLFFPMGLMKGGLPTFRRPSGPVKLEPSKVTVAAPKPIISSSLAFTAGIILLVLGVDAFAIPGYLILKSITVVAGGAAMAVVGAYAMYYGSTKPKEV
jgi:hypothetical protein